MHQIYYGTISDIVIEQNCFQEQPLRLGQMQIYESLKEQCYPLLLNAKYIFLLFWSEFFASTKSPAHLNNVIEMTVVTKFRKV